MAARIANRTTMNVMVMMSSITVKPLRVSILYYYSLLHRVSIFREANLPAVEIDSTVGAEFDGTV